MNTKKDAKSPIKGPVAERMGFESDGLVLRPKQKEGQARRGLSGPGCRLSCFGLRRRRREQLDPDLQAQVACSPSLHAADRGGRQLP
jgi:hypothetical protein